MFCMVCDEYVKASHFREVKIREDGAVTHLCPTKNKRGIFNPRVRVVKVVN